LQRANDCPFLVVRRPHPADRRATLLELTTAGERLADSALLPRFIALEGLDNGTAPDR
jgi:DNA-binding MarR family transcriptional regulator